MRPLARLLAAVVTTVLALLVVVVVQLAVLGAGVAVGLVAGLALERALPMIPGVYEVILVAGCLAGWSLSLAAREPMNDLLLLRVMPRLWGEDYPHVRYGCPGGRQYQGRAVCARQPGARRSSRG